MAFSSQYKHVSIIVARSLNGRELPVTKRRAKSLVANGHARWIVAGESIKMLVPISKLGWARRVSGGYVVMELI